MIYQYELACKEAGLSEEQTAAIRNFLDGQKKKVAHEKDVREELGITFSFSSVSADRLDEIGDKEEMDFVDEDFDLEELIIHKLEIDRLNECLEELPAEDREFILSVYAERGYARRYAKEHGMNEMAVSRKKAALLQTLREKIFEKN